MGVAPSTAVHGRVLVIDDDEFATALLKQTLEAAGFSVWALLSPVGASQLIERIGIQVAVLDVNMPLIAGDRLVKLLRSWEPFKHLPIILVSGMSSPELHEVAEGLSGVSVVTKARVAQELAALVTKAIDSNATLLRSGESPIRPRPFDAVQTFLKQLPDNMAQALALWERVCIGKRTERTLLRGLLHMLKGQSQLLGYEQLGDLFSVILDLLSALPADRPVQSSTEQSVARAFGLVAAQAKSPSNLASPFDPGTTLDHLTHIRDGLRVA